MVGVARLATSRPSAGRADGKQAIVLPCPQSTSTALVVVDREVACEGVCDQHRGHLAAKLEGCPPQLQCLSVEGVALLETQDPQSLLFFWGKSLIPSNLNSIYIYIYILGRNGLAKLQEL